MLNERNARFIPNDDECRPICTTCVHILIQLTDGNFGFNFTSTGIVGTMADPETAATFEFEIVFNVDHPVYNKDEEGMQRLE